MSRRWFETVRRQRARDQAASGHSLSPRGEMPSGLYHGTRVQVLRTQQHPLLGERLELRLGPTLIWVLASEVGERHGEVGS